MDPPLLTVVGLLAVVAVSAVDGTIISTAMPQVVAAIGGLDLYAWAFASFMLANTAATHIFGRYADQYGVKPCLAMALLIFLAGSVLTGFATTMAQLVAYRAVQGAGVGGLVTLASAAFGLLYVPERRARAQSLVSMIWGVASLAGPFAGGLMVTYLPWPWIFWVNVPVGLAAAALASRGLPGLVPQPPADDPNVRFLPIWRNVTFVVAVALSFGACFTMYPALNYVPFYVQGVLSRGAPEAGAALTPMMVAWPIGSTAAGALMNRAGFRPLVTAGALLMAVGFGLMALPSVADASWSLALPAALVGAGMGVTASTALVASQTSVPQHRIGEASASIGVARNLGGALGLIAFGALQMRLLRAGLPFGEQGHSPIADEGLRAFTRPGIPGLAAPSEAAFRTALGSSLREVFAAAAVLALICCVGAWQMPAETPVQAAKRGTQPL